MNTERMEQILLDEVNVEESFLNGAICVGGYNRETMERVLFYMRGYRTFEQYLDIEEE